MEPENEKPDEGEIELEFDEIDFEPDDNADENDEIEAQPEIAQPTEQEITPFDPPVSGDVPEPDLDLSDEPLPLALEKLPCEEISISLQLRACQAEEQSQEREVWVGVRLGKGQPQFAVLTLAELGDLPPGILNLLGQAVEAKPPEPPTPKQPPVPVSTNPTIQTLPQATPTSGGNNGRQLPLF